MGDDLGARRSFQRAAELNPGNPELHFLIASAAWQLADLEVAWGQAISAWQAGYDPARIQQLFDQMARYFPPPVDLEARLGAPRVYVQLLPETGDPDVTLIAQDLNSELYRAPLIALVREPSIARFRARVERQEDGRIRLTLWRLADEAELGARLLPVGTDDAATQLALSAFVGDVRSWTSE
jgi:hypothetical protein